MNAYITLNRPNGILYGCRFGAFFYDDYNSVYVDDYDIGKNPTMSYFYSQCAGETGRDVFISYGDDTNDNASVNELCCKQHPSGALSYNCFVLFNSHTIGYVSIENYKKTVSGGEELIPNTNGMSRVFKILDGKIFDEETGSFDDDLTKKFETILTDSDSSKYLHDTMLVSSAVVNPPLTYDIYTYINPMYNDYFINSGNILSLKFKDLDGNTMNVSDITSDESDKNLVVESDRYEQGYYLKLDVSSVFRYTSGEPDRYVPKFNLRWKIPSSAGNYYTATNSYFGAYVKDKDGKFICISQPKIQVMGSYPIEYITFPIELYPNKNLYYEENGNISIYLVRFKGFGVEQDIFKTNLINTVTDFIKTY